MRGDLAVVEMMLDGPHDLIVLMALARDEHDITRTGCLDGIAYGLGAIGHDDVAVLVSLHADEYLLDDGIGVFRARVVACHDGDVGGEGRGSHLGTLAMIAIATTAEDADDATLRDGTYGIDGLLDRVGRMRVVDEDTEIGTRGAVSSAETMSSLVKPSATPMPKVTSAFSTLKRPTSGMVTCSHSPHASRSMRVA